MEIKKFESNNCIIFHGDVIKALDEKIENSNAMVQDIRIKNPNNPVQLIGVKLLIFKV